MQHDAYISLLQRIKLDLLGCTVVRTHPLDPTAQHMVFCVLRQDGKTLHYKCEPYGTWLTEIIRDTKMVEFKNPDDAIEGIGNAEELGYLWK